MSSPYADLQARLAPHIPAHRLMTDPLTRKAWGTDASYFQLIPQLIVLVASEDEVHHVLQHCTDLGISVTFRAAGTSLSGQAVTDSVLVMLADCWRDYEICDQGRQIRVQPGLIGSAVNQLLAPYGRKIGPDPASINAAMIGGIAANNASGMCCGTAQNSYNTLAGMRLMLADGTLLDTRDTTSVSSFRQQKADLLASLSMLRARINANPDLRERIARKYRMKNTTGYSLNALIDFSDPIDILIHLMIGSEGTLGFISAVDYHTVPEYAHKATTLVLFEHLREACQATIALKNTPVAAVELMDRAALRSVENKTGMPHSLQQLGINGAGLLIEARAENADALASAVANITDTLANFSTIESVDFVKDPASCQQLWNIRKGMFPSVGAIRASGTTVIIEDVAFPLAHLADATLDLQALMFAHGYHEGIIFGHALEGNLHFVFTQAFDSEQAIARYDAFLQAVCRLVVEKYDGSLKAEHGTGRNIAPFVELEWGSQAYALMWEIKKIFDPNNLLSPGVILDNNPNAHLQHTKAMPPVNAGIDKCIECGFCEPKCPSKCFTLSPRQRISAQRQMSTAVHDEQAQQTYQWLGIETCAACGLCEIACPVGINTGEFIKSLRAKQRTSWQQHLATHVANHFSMAAYTARTALRIGHGVQEKLGARALRTLEKVGRYCASLPVWHPNMPLAAPKLTLSGITRKELQQVVYFPSCANRVFGASPTMPQAPTVTQWLPRILTHVGWEVIYPAQVEGLCCGMPFDSKGFAKTAQEQQQALLTSLKEVSKNGRYPILVDASPCTLRLAQSARQAGLVVYDVAAFLHDEVLPHITIKPVAEKITVHVTCSSWRLGSGDKLIALAKACATKVVIPPSVGCCGFAGDKGFQVPALNAHALRHLAAETAGCTAGYSTSRTCEIGLAQHAGIHYDSIVQLFARCLFTKEIP